MTDFAIHRAELCGLHIGQDATIDVMNGEVTTSTIGACVTSDAYDLSRLMTDVHYRDNDTNLNTSGLPVPRVTPVEL